MKALKSFIANSLACIAPYTVINNEFGKEHLCWTWKQACQWMACYDASDFGSTHVFNFNGEMIAVKY